MLRIIFHRAISLLVALAVLLTSLPYTAFAHRHADAEAGHAHFHHHHGAHTQHHGHSHHHHHGSGTQAALSSQQLVHCHVYWWGLELTLPGSPQQPDQEPNLNQFAAYSVPPFVVAFVPNATLRLLADVGSPVAELEALLAPTFGSPMVAWQMPLRSRLCDIARRARSGVLLV